VIGLGYVGLPLAVAFSKKFKTIGFDINSQRIGELKSGIDRTKEVTADELKSSSLIVTDQLDVLKEANFHIVAVPTPIDVAKQPDLGPLLKASETLGKILKAGDVVVYESTVYPGCTEEDCIPVLERVSGLVAGRDFKVGYSPERINPGDKEHTFEKIKKVVSGQDADCLERVANVYGTVVTAGVHKAESIKVAEAAKVIENTQRDLNVALMNELAVLFDLMGVDTKSVLEAAGTKWNFLKFTPGLVGGHCIGVDPYYLTHKAEKMGYHPQVILAGRRINDNMGRFIASKAIKQMALKGLPILGTRATVLGLTFKENCPDLRNSKVIDIIHGLKEYGVEVQVCDPYVNVEDAKEEYGIDLVPFEDLQPAEALVVAVAHDTFKKMSPQKIQSLMCEKGTLLDVKAIFSKEHLKEIGVNYWRL